MVWMEASFLFTQYIMDKCTLFLKLLNKHAYQHNFTVYPIAVVLFPIIA